MTVPDDVWERVQQIDGAPGFIEGRFNRGESQ